MKNRKHKEYFTQIFSPLELNSDDQHELKSTIRANNEISAVLGETHHIEDQLSKPNTIQPFEFTMEQFQFAKKIYDELEKQNGDSNKKENRNLEQKLKKITRDMILGNESLIHPSVDQIPLKQMAVYRALTDNDDDLFSAIQQNRLKDNEILNYLEGKEENFNDTDSIDKLISDDMKSEYEKYKLFSNWEDESGGINEFDLDSNAIYTPPLHFNEEINKIPAKQPSLKKLKEEMNANEYVQRIQQLQEKQKIRMYEDLEHIDFLMKNSEQNLQLASRSEGIHYIRLLYHEKIVALKNAQELFHQQLKKMRRAHLLQMKNMEAFAITAAQEMFKQKTKQLIELFNSDTKKLTTEYSQMHNLVNFYEKKMRMLTGQLIRQEKLIIEQTAYIMQHLKRQGDYKDRKNIALQHLNELVKDKYSKLDNKEYLDQSFDFFSVYLRLAGHEKDKIVRSAVFRLQEKETQEFKVKSKMIERENEIILGLLQDAQDKEQQVRFKLMDLQQEFDQVQEKHQKEMDKVQNEHRHKFERLKNHLQKKEQEIKDYMALANQESDICHKVMEEQRRQLIDYKSQLRITETLLSNPKFSSFYHDKVRRHFEKEQSKLTYQTLQMIMKETFYLCKDLVSNPNTQMPNTNEQNTFVNNTQMNTYVTNSQFVPNQYYKRTNEHTISQNEIPQNINVTISSTKSRNKQSPSKTSSDQRQPEMNQSMMQPKTLLKMKQSNENYYGSDNEAMQNLQNHTLSNDLYQPSTTTRLNTNQDYSMFREFNNYHAQLTKTSIDWNQQSLLKQTPKIHGNPNGTLFSSTDSTNPLYKNPQQQLSNQYFIRKNYNTNQILSQPQTRGDRQQLQEFTSSFDNQSIPANNINQQQQQQPLTTQKSTKKDRYFYFSMSNFNTARNNRNKMNETFNLTARGGPKGFDCDKILQKTSERMVPLYVNKKLIDIKRVKVEVEDSQINQDDLTNRKKTQREHLRTNVLYKREKQFSLNERSIRKEIARYSLNSSIELQRKGVEEVKNGGIFDNRTINIQMRLNTASIDS